MSRTTSPTRDAPPPAFAVWLTGRPASGKSTIAAALLERLAACGIRPAHLESDELRKVLTPEPTYTDAERDWFYRVVAYFGEQLLRHGVPVIFDATANRRAYRDRARAAIGRFIEVYVDCPLEVCRQRDPKGIYRGAGRAIHEHVPGVQAAYEPPAKPDMVVKSEQESPDDAARRIVDLLRRRGMIDA